MGQRGYGLSSGEADVIGDVLVGCWLILAAVTVVVLVYVMYTGG
jgi:hypothetical protein